MTGEQSRREAAIKKGIDALVRSLDPEALLTRNFPDTREHRTYTVVHSETAVDLLYRKTFFVDGLRRLLEVAGYEAHEPIGDNGGRTRLVIPGVMSLSIQWGSK